MAMYGGDLDGGQYTSLEEIEIQNLKKQLKETFTKIALDKETFDTLKENMKKYRIVQSSEKLMNSADEALRKYEHQLLMLRGTSGDSRSKFERDLETLKIGLKDSRAKYFEMEEKC